MQQRQISSGRVGTIGSLIAAIPIGLSSNVPEVVGDNALSAEQTTNDGQNHLVPLVFHGCHSGKNRCMTSRKQGMGLETGPVTRWRRPVSRSIDGRRAAADHASRGGVFSD